MNKFFKLNKVILQTLFLNIFLLTTSSVCLEKYYDGDKVSTYFSGIISLQQNKYKESYNFFKSLNNLEDSHSKYSKSYVETLVNNSKINEAFIYANKLKKKEMNFFQSDIVIISKFIKNENFNKADDYINTTHKRNYTPLQKLVSQIASSWVQVEKFKLNFNEAQSVFQSINPKYKNLKKINNVFLNCYFDTLNVETKFLNLINDKTTDFSRYTFFYVDYLLKKNFLNKANSVLKSELIDVPRNLLLNQLYLDINHKKKKLFKK